VEPLRESRIDPRVDRLDPALDVPPQRPVDMPQPPRDRVKL
jgi:hypothetical protein